MMRVLLFLALVALASCQNATNATCASTLGQLCPEEKGQGAACYKCLFSHYANVTAANCTGKDLHAYCGSGHNTEGCEKALTQYCGAYAGQHYYCFQCVTSNTDALKAAGCTIDNYDKFCESHIGDNCTAKLQAVCGADQHDGHRCDRCVQSHKPTLDGAGCNLTDYSAFCNKHHGKGPHHGGHTPHHGKTPHQHGGHTPHHGKTPHQHGGHTPHHGKAPHQHGGHTPHHGGGKAPHHGGHGGKAPHHGHGGGKAPHHGGGGGGKTPHHGHGGGGKAPHHGHGGGGKSKTKTKTHGHGGDLEMDRPILMDSNPQ